jgi:hypothetical protein
MTIENDSEPTSTSNLIFVRKFSHTKSSHFFLYNNQDETDILYEEDCLRNQYSVKTWLRYIDHIKDVPNEKINLVYERALRELPGRYIHSYFF